MYPNDNIFNIYYNIGRRTPFLVKRVREGLYGCRSEEEFYTTKGKTFMVERVEPRGQYGKAYGYCLWNGERNDDYMKETYPDITDGEIPSSGCGGWVLVDVPNVDINEVFPILKPDEVMQFGIHKGLTYREIYDVDSKYLWDLSRKDHYFRIDLYALAGISPDDPNAEELLHNEFDRVYKVVKVDDEITFGKYKGKTYRDVFKEDPQYIQWFLSENNRLYLDMESFTNMLNGK